MRQPVVQEALTPHRTLELTPAGQAMQQYLTLEEAAKMLLISVDDLREMAKKKTIRAFQDRGSWRFRLQDIEELARKRGINSDPEVRLAEGRKGAALDDDDEVPLGKEKSSQGSRGSDRKSVV